MAKPDPNSADASNSIARRIEQLADWRGETLARVRQLIHDVDPTIQEEWKWSKQNSDGTPVWSHDGIVCTGESYKQVVKLMFARRRLGGGSSAGLQLQSRREHALARRASQKK